ncbi:MAG: DUF885 domain-containing protein, partial [Chloroflexota bacterium]|nr:DUF885 domain-containing protein [Chloroflexota bacterium]
MPVKPRSILVIAALILTVVCLGACGLISKTGITIAPAESPTQVLSEGTTDPIASEVQAEQPAEVEKAATQSANEEPPGASTEESIDEFFESSWRELMLRYPEWVLAEGLSEEFGLEEVTLTDISDEYVLETNQLVQDIMNRLQTYDREQLSPEHQVSYDVYEWYLDDALRRAEYEYYDYLVTFFPITSVHDGTLYFFTDLHPITSKKDAEDYVTRLNQVDTKFEQLIENLKQRETAGIVPPQFAIQWAIPGVREMANADPIDTPYFMAFWDKVYDLDDLSKAERHRLTDAAEKAIEKSVLPAYQDLLAYLQHQQSVASTDDGLWQFEDGNDYYGYLLRHFTTTDMSADEIHQLGLDELERIHAEMRQIFDLLGYPLDENLVQLYDRVANDAGYVSGSQVLETYEKIISEAEGNLDSAFDLRPGAELVVINSPIKGMYVHPSLDGSRPGVFHAGPADTSEQYYAMPTLAYHEGVPGHHFQISIAMEADLPLFRNMIGFTGYAEGWALYAEMLASELGWYEGDPYGDLGRLQGEALRAVRLVVDTGIHTRGWSFEEASQFLSENTGFERRDSMNPDHQIARYIVYPGQATAYKIGMLKILELRQRAMDELGEQFDLKEFHNVVLSNGSMP